MCGINGFVSFDSAVTPEVLGRMNQKIKHRGPDDSGIFIRQKRGYSIGFGHVRLSILDLSKKGHQPMGLCVGEEKQKCRLVYSDQEEPDYLISFNGEIYNFQELQKELMELGYGFESQCDTEVLLKGYAQWGSGVLSKLNGMFAFVIWDREKELLFGARDRLGKKPLKYYFDQSRFLFSSELKAILTHPIVREVDLNAIDDYLTLQYVPAPATGFQGIYKLEHATFFLYDLKTKKMHKERYWDLAFDPKLDLTEAELRKKIERELEESVKRRMIADVEVGSFLSGGVDSSAVVAFASRYKEGLKTFTIKFQEKAFDESEFAKKVARKYGTDHRDFLVDPEDMLSMMEEIVAQYEEPYADVSQLPTYILSKKTSEYVKVVLNGDGGDENFAGYDKYRIHAIAQKLRLLPFQNQIAACCKKIAEWKNSALFYQLFVFFQTLKESPVVRHFNYTRYFDTFMKEELYLDHVKSRLREDRFESFRRYEKKLSPIESILYLDFQTYLPDDLMVKVDIATLAFGLESRSPLLDYTFVENCAKIPLRYKICGRKRKKILKEVLEGRYLDRDILYRKKKGFDVPVNDWFRNQLKEYLRDLLLDPQGLTLNLFKKEMVEKLLTDHTKGRNNGKKLWVLLTLNLWYREYFLKNAQ